MKHAVTLGVVCLARRTFDFEAAAGIYARILEDLRRVENTTVESVDESVVEVSDARRAGAYLQSRGVDAVACISGTFHLGHLVLEIEKAVHRPLLLWALPELPHEGGKIRLNSACGINLDASNLYKAGIRTYHAAIRRDLDMDWLDAVRIDRALREAHVGLAGYRAQGFFNLAVYDLNAYSNLGVLLDHYELEEIWSTEVTHEQAAARKDQLQKVFDVSRITAEQLEKVASLSAKIHAFLDSRGLDALAIRCWPEHAARFGVSPCAAMSLLQSEHRIIACEGDVEGMLSMIAQRALGAETPFLADFSQVDFDNDTALLWHCGVAPCNLRDEHFACALDPYFAAGRGVTADFVIKGGELTLLRIDSAGTEYRMFLEKATGVPADQDLKGTYLNVRFDRPARDVLFSVIENGIAHHTSVAHGDFSRPLELFARMHGWRIVR